MDRPQYFQGTTNVNDRIKRERRRSLVGMWSAVIGAGLMIILLVVVLVISINRRVADGEATDDTAVAADEETDSEIVDEGDSDYDAIDLSGYGVSAGSVELIINGTSQTLHARYVIDEQEVVLDSGKYGSGIEDLNVFLVIGDGRLVLNNASVISKANNANAIIVANGGEVVMNNDVIRTEGDNSAGIYMIDGGTVTAGASIIDTSGLSSEALRIKGGTVVGTSLTIDTNNERSPLIFSSGDVTLNESNGAAKKSQIAIIENGNSVSLNGCNLSAEGTSGESDILNSAILMYGNNDFDGQVGVFTSNNTSLSIIESEKYDSVPFLMVTNVYTSINMDESNVTFSDRASFVKAAGTEFWGDAGDNGGNATISLMKTETTNRRIEQDEISDVSITASTVDARFDRPDYDGTFEDTTIMKNEYYDE